MTDAVEHRYSTPWPCDFGARTQSTYNPMLRRTVRARWRRCLGTCDGKWFWSTDALTHRMCRRCSPHAGDGDGSGPAQSEERAAEAMRAPASHPTPSIRSSTQRAVICEGRRFFSAEAAADALGLTALIVKQRCTRGWRGWHWANKPTKELRDKAWRPVIAAGQRYPSVAAAARALRVTPDRIGYRIARGWVGYSYDD